MDSSHVALVHVLLRDDCFVKYQCERNTVLGINLVSLSKVLKIIDGSDSLSLHHEEDADTILLTSENAEKTRKCEYQLKLLDIETESLGIPEMDYRSTVTLSSNEFAKIVRDMAIFGDVVTIAVSADGVKFSSSGFVGQGYTFLQAAGIGERQNKKPRHNGSAMKSEVKAERRDYDDNITENEEGAHVNDDDDDVNQPLSRKYSKNDNADPVGVDVQTDEPITLSFAIRFMNILAKGSSLSDRVTLKFAKDSPCMVEYGIDNVGYLRYYLAPKVDSAE